MAKLHAMRYMTLEERRDAVRFIIDRNFSISQTVELCIKAYKQYIDLEGDRVGFSDKAGDR